MAELATARGVDVRFVKFENASHGMSYLENTEKYRRIASDFINEILERNK